MRKLLTFCALAVMTLIGAPQVLKAADADGECPLQNASLSGTYVSHGTGTIIGVGPISAVGTVTYDGKGNSVNTFTASVNGAIFRGVTVTGTYTVNPDCTGSLTQANGTQHYDFVVSQGGARVDWIGTDSSEVLSGTEVRLRHDDPHEAAVRDGQRDASRYVDGPSNVNSLRAKLSQEVSAAAFWCCRWRAG